MRHMPSTGVSGIDLYAVDENGKWTFCNTNFQYSFGDTIKYTFSGISYPTSAKEKGYEFYTDDPQKLYPDVLPHYIEEMEKLGWDRGQDDEELFEFAMHEKQYREYKSGLAKEQFNKDLLERMEKAAKGGQQVTFISAADKRAILHPNSEPVEAPQAGTVLWELDYNEDSHAPAFGKLFRQGDLVCYLQTQHGIEPLTASFDSRLVAIDKQQGEKVVKGDAICWLEKAEIPAEPKATAKPKESKADKKPAAAKKSAWKDSMNVIKAEKK